MSIGDYNTMPSYKLILPKEKKMSEKNIIYQERDESPKNVYRITLKPLVKFWKRDNDDKAYFGDFTEMRWSFIGNDHDEALDKFHNSIPIAVLDDFDISIEQIG